MGMWEVNIGRVFQHSINAWPCAGLLDELYSVAAKRGNQGDSAGVMDRIVHQLTAELDGITYSAEGSGGVLVL